jgi:large-conductance mechanosensitive channel
MPQTQFAVKELLTGLTEPTILHQLKLERYATYLAGEHETVWVFAYKQADKAYVVKATVDSDWAGDVAGRKSTGGGYEFVNHCLIAGNCNQQPVISLSSAEAEFYEIVNGSARCLWTRSFLLAIGRAVDTIIIESDSSAAKGISERFGTGKLRHLQAKDLWVQQKVHDKLIRIQKVPTETNVGDLQTKYLDPLRFKSLVAQLPMRASTARRQSSSLVACVLLSTISRTTASVAVVALSQPLALTEAFAYSTILTTILTIVIVAMTALLIGGHLSHISARREFQDATSQTEPWIQTQWFRLTVPELRDACRHRGLRTSGLKGELAQALIIDELELR